MKAILQTAVKALVFRGKKTLILRESPQYREGTNQGRYDVPGGRIKPGQRYYKSLLREINEETGLSVKIGRPFHVDEWKPKVAGRDLNILGIFFECFADSDKVRLSKDHDNYLWINPIEYKKFNLVPGLERVFESYLRINGRV